VIERCHHHILWTRIPSYRREHLRQAQTVDKSVFECWTHALSYVPTENMAFFLPDMKRHQRSPRSWFASVTKEDLRKVLSLVRRGGPISIRDIEDDVLVEKDHAWASRKPSKRALQLAFFNGALTVSERSGMLKTYELTARHFGWNRMPKPASERQVRDYLLDRALRSQGVVSLDSVCHLDARRKPAIRELIEARVRRGQLSAVAIDGEGKAEHWIEPPTLDAIRGPADAAIHILSPFDPLIIQRKRLKLFFDYDHRFEAYLPRDKRVFGYFALPVLVGDQIVAAIDLKTDRERRAVAHPTLDLDRRRIGCIAQSGNRRGAPSLRAVSDRLLNTTSSPASRPARSRARAYRPAGRQEAVDADATLGRRAGADGAFDHFRGVNPSPICVTMAERGVSHIELAEAERLAEVG
jgi:uncharacterized protein YcaQ